ncbi:MAG: FAD-dependent oxidoreductase [Ruminococcaceae bacterium]|nr:FAD-dependent oxidoreductase [Oscillospiraceae bacterium]
MDYSKLPVFAEADVVVCGGGTAGAFAAKAAADMGKDVLIVEQFGALGGTATNGLVLPIMHTHIPENPQCSYIANIVRDKMVELGAASANGANFDPLLMKTVLETVCDEAGVRMLFYTFIAETIVNDNKLEAIVVANKNGLGLIKGKIFIDGTGDGDVCVRAGAGYTKGNPETGKNQPISLRYIVANVDIRAFGEFINETIEKTGKNYAASYDGSSVYVACCAGDQWTFSDIFDEAIKNGDLIDDDKNYWQGFMVAGRENTIAFNNPEFFDEVDGTNPDHLTKTQIRGKQRILRQLQFYKKYMKGFEKAYIAEIATMVGIRESRNIETEYVLSAADLLRRVKFDDMFCQSNYPVDIHGKQLKCESNLAPVDDGKPWYEIPYRSLVVKGIDNLYITGRCLGAEFLAQSSLRVQHSVRASGEAAGIGAALALDRDILPKQVDGKEVREIMISKGAHFVL